MKRLFLFAAALIAAGAGPAQAGISYDFVSYDSLQNSFTLSGSITTDGTIGTLAASNIVAWNYTITDGTMVVASVSSSTPNSIVLARNLTATSTQLTLTPSVDGLSNFLGFTGGLGYTRNPGGSDFYQGDFATQNIIWLDHGQSPANPLSLGGDPWVIATVKTVGTPEPSSMMLVGVTLLGAAGYGWRKRQRAAV